MINDQLKILGVVIHKGCSKSIKKNLREDEIYPLYRVFKDYSPADINHSYDTGIPAGFFLGSSLNLKISISAIVGSNGSGKSGLIDIVLRLINNAACKLVENYDYTNNLVLVRGLKASMYYSIGKDVFCLNQNGDLLSQMHLYRIIDGKKKSIPFNKKYFSEYFFYTILLNYSIHAFNTLDYMDEWDKTRKHVDDNGCWLKGMFHKNDGYLAPLVLNPKRTKGNIDINIENHLAKSRLLALVFNENGQANTSYTYINETHSISSIKINLDIASVEEKYNGIFEWWSDTKVDYDATMQQYLHDCIISLWADRYKFERKSVGNAAHDSALKYLVYKTISIATKYNAFDHFHALSPYYKNLSKEEWDYEIDSLITELDRDRSHITFRLRQILAYLVYHQYDLHDEENQPIKIDDFAKIPHKYNIDLHKWRFTDIVPPPIFATEILVRDSDTNEEFNISRLSSGERQLSYVSSTIIYHLRNINSVPINIRRTKYRHINIILDEIELYFHPSYQKGFIKHILNCLKTAKLDDLISVNIIMVTHSPFILSDIPKANVLFLKDGEPDYEMQENTFASNIHTILQNGFFLGDGTIGDFAKDKVNDMFSQLHDGKLSGELKESIKLVSEPILRSQLIKLYSEQSSISNNDIEYLMKMILNLENEIKSLKDDKN